MHAMKQLFLVTANITNTHAKFSNTQLLDHTLPSRQGHGLLLDKDGTLWKNYADSVNKPIHIFCCIGKAGWITSTVLNRENKPQQGNK